MDSDSLPPIGKKYIITTGDISDFDGFLTFPMYKKIAIEKGFEAVVFIMNYPAYFFYKNRWGDFMNEDEFKQKYPTDTDKEKFGFYVNHQGYEYSYKDFYYYYYEFFQGIGITEPDELYHKMNELAYKMCYHIWNSIEGDMKFIFVNGGINQLNPFSINKLKNEIKVYNIPEIEVPEKDKHFDRTQLLTDFIRNLTVNDEIYMDMNGSFAFYDIHVNREVYLNDFTFFNCIKALSIMGGVYNSSLVKTYSVSFINRLSSATMNQYYHPYNTEDFLSKLVSNNPNCKIFIVSNNYINDVFVWSDKEKFITDMKEWNLLNDNYLEFFNAYYKNETKYKPFDIVSTMALINAIKNPNYHLLTKKTKFLFSKIFGLTIIDKTDERNKFTFLNAYCKYINTETLDAIQDCEKKLTESENLSSTFNDILPSDILPSNTLPSDILPSNILYKIYILYMFYINGLKKTSKESEIDMEKHKNLLQFFFITEEKKKKLDIKRFFYLYDVYDIEDITRDDIREFMIS